MNKGQPIDQHGDIVTIVVSCPVFRADDILIDYLQTVIMDVFPVNERDVFGHTVIAFQHLNVVFLDFRRFFYDAVIGIGDRTCKKTLPLGIAELIMIELREL